MENDISYGPDRLLVAFWAILCSPPALITGYLFLKSPTTKTAVQFCCMLIFPLAPMVFASRFRVTFSPTEFVYRRWGPTVRVPYSDIASVEATNVTPISKQPVGAFIVTRDGRRLPFWPKLFPKKAIERFFALGR
jgi:hypothetical protein